MQPILKSFVRLSLACKVVIVKMFGRELLSNNLKLFVLQQLYRETSFFYDFSYNSMFVLVNMIIYTCALIATNSNRSLDNNVYQFQPARWKLFSHSAETWYIQDNEEHTTVKHTTGLYILVD